MAGTSPAMTVDGMSQISFPLRPNMLSAAHPLRADSCSERSFCRPFPSRSGACCQSRLGHCWPRWLVLGFIVLFAQASRTLSLPLTAITHNPLSLSPWALPKYATFTALRMLIAMGVSLVFTFTYSDARGEKPPRRRAAHPAARHPAVRADPRFHFCDSDLLLVAGAGPRVRSGARLRLRAVHQPGLEHGVQLLPVAAHGAGWS